MHVFPMKASRHECSDNQPHQRVGSFAQPTTHAQYKLPEVVQPKIVLSTDNSSPEDS